MTPARSLACRLESDTAASACSAIAMASPDWPPRVSSLTVSVT